MTRKLKNSFQIILALILANMCYSCENVRSDVYTEIIQAKFLLNGIGFNQMQLSSSNNLIGISGADNKLIFLPGNDKSNNLTRIINTKGQVISLNLLKEDILLILLIPFQHQDSLQLVKASLKSGEIIEEINIFLRPKELIFDDVEIREIDKDVNLIFNVQRPTAQILPFDNGYSAIVIRKHITPTVIWVKDKNVSIEQPLFPNPVNDFETKLKMSLGRFRAWKKGDALMVIIDNDPSYHSAIKSYFPQKSGDFHLHSHIIFESKPSGLALIEGKTFGYYHKLFDDGKGNIFFATVEQDRLIIGSDNNFEFSTTIKGLQPKIVINDFYINESGIWLAGETDLMQVSSGSIVAGSKAFLANVLFKDGTASLKVWDYFKGRRNCVTNIFVSQGQNYFTLFENEPLTHDTDRTSTLSLLRMEDFGFKIVPTN